MQTNAPANAEFVDQFNRAVTFQQIQVGNGGSSLTNPLVLPDGGSINTLNNGGVGGSITMTGSTDGDNVASSGSINLSAGNADGGQGGSIDLSGGSGGTASGGSLIMRGGGSSGAFAGSINTSGIPSNGGDPFHGGSINTVGGDQGSGGDINTSNGGGNLFTGGGGGVGGTLDLRGYEGGIGGSIIAIGKQNTSAGFIDLSSGEYNGDGGNGGNGGHIDLTGGASNEFGYGAAGGSITLAGGSASDNPNGYALDAGNINLSSGGGSIESSGSYDPVNEEPVTGGSIITSAYPVANGNGGYINTSANSGGPGGNIVTANNGGNIFTFGSVGSTGGSINTSEGGGSINTRGTGSIEMGVAGTRTTLTGTATANRTQTLPNESGTIAVINVGSVNIDFPNIPGNSTLSQDVTVTGVAVGEAVLVTCTNVRTGNDQRIVFTGFVATTPANTVTVLASNTGGAGVNLPSLAFKIIVFKGI